VSKIVSVHSFRGGTGKSNLTANLAASLACRGGRIAIVDTDIQSPGIHALFGFDEERITRSLNEYLWGKCAIVDAAHDVSTTLAGELGGPLAANGALFLVPSSIRATEIARVLREGYDVGLLNDGFQDLIDGLDLDYLFVDTHPGLNEETLLSISLSDVLVLLLRPDRQDFQGTAVTVDVARQLDVPKLLLVLNKVLSSVDVTALRSNVEQTYQASVAGVLPLAEELLELGSGGIFSLRQPSHLWSQGVIQILDEVAT
jgi:MinD-like ATPase involved in chromosome partitioning or flagellar assembly